MTLDDILKEARKGFNDELAIGTPPIFCEVKGTVEILGKTYEVWCLYENGLFKIEGEEIR